MSKFDAPDIKEFGEFLLATIIGIGERNVKSNL